MDPKSAKKLPERRSNRKRKVDHVGRSTQETPTNVSSATPAENGDSKSIWGDNFPFGDFIDKHFITEKDREAFEEWKLEKCFHVLQSAAIQSAALVRCLEQRFGDLEKKYKACIEENTELKNKLSELSFPLAEREEGLMKGIVEKMEAETKYLKAEIQELRDRILDLCFG